MVLEDIMTANPITAAPDWTVRQAFETLHDNDFRHLPVVHNDELVGMVSDRDLQRYVTPTTAAIEDPSQSRALLDEAIADVMHGDVHALNSESDVEEAIALMVEQRIGAVPVVSPIEGALVGIVTYIDVLRAARDLF